MNDNERQEWSRHYDTIQWVVIAIFTAGVGALLATSFEKGTEWWPDAFGIPLTTLGLFYVAGFRYFRLRFHTTIQDPELRDILQRLGPKKWPHQWQVFVAVFSVVGCTFSWRLASKVTGSCATTVACLSSVLILTIHFLIWRRGEPE